VRPQRVEHSLFAGASVLPCDGALGAREVEQPGVGVDGRVEPACGQQHIAREMWMSNYLMRHGFAEKLVIERTSRNMTRAHWIGPALSIAHASWTVRQSAPVASTTSAAAARRAARPPPPPKVGAFIWRSISSFVLTWASRPIAFVQMEVDWSAMLQVAHRM